MTGASPWSVKGISAEERELAKQAARRAGVPIGKWLSRQIRDAAEQERRVRVASRPPATGADDTIHAAEAAPVTAGSTAAAWRTALAAPPLPSREDGRPDAGRDLEARLAALEHADRRLTALAVEIAGLGARIDRLEQRSEGQSDAVIRQMRSIGAEIEALRARPDVTDAAPSTAPLERAVARLGERLQMVEALTLRGERGFGERSASRARTGEPGSRSLLARLFRR